MPQPDVAPTRARLGQHLRTMIDRFPEVLRAAQSGDTQAVAELWRAVNPGLLLFLTARNPDAAEDLASETWLAAAVGIADFAGDEPDFRAWIYTIARHKLIDRHRRALRSPVDVAPDEELGEQVADDDPMKEVLDALDTDAALRLIRKLAPDQAEVILLRVVAGLDMARVAEILGKRPGAIRVLQHRGLRRLAQLLESDRRDEDVTQ
jgi:RNA polymerase sigma-70 factor, ECF subfamily